MKRTHALLISLVLALAVLLGAFAAMRSTQLRSTASTTTVGSSQIARQNAALDRAEAALRAELVRKPPAIPPLPAAPRAAPAPQQTVVYRRAPTIVKVLHHHGDDGEHGHDGEGGEVDD